jgi:ABC-type dipeptide/oligopeptide/nickel transport system ATPase component
VGRQDQFLFWLNGQAGTGKSTIALTVAQRFHDEKRLGASFFFSRDQNGRNNAKMFFTTLASQLADLSPDLNYLISEAIAKHRGIAGKQPHEQWNRLIIDPLRQCQSHWSPIVVVIDALDEYDGEDGRDRENDIREILHLFIQLKDLDNIRLRIFITSRPEIRNSIEVPPAIICDVPLHCAEDSELDIGLFLRDELSDIQKHYCPEEEWPALEQIQRLTKKAGKLFIYAATACRHINSRILYRRRLSMILEGDTTGMEDLHKMYTQILEQSVPHASEDEKSRFRVSLRSIVGTIIVLSIPLSASALHKLLPTKIAAELDVSINEYLFDLHSVLDVPDDRNLPVRVSHLSFREFLLDEKKYENKDFWISEQKAHRNLLNRCLEVMGSLKEDICGLQIPGESRKDVDKQTIDRCLPPEVQYTCLYWVDHLKGSKGNIQDGDHVHQFLRCHFLHWLEALSLIGRISDTIGLIDELQSMADVSHSSMSYASVS